MSGGSANRKSLKESMKISWSCLPSLPWQVSYQTKLSKLRPFPSRGPKMSKDVQSMPVLLQLQLLFPSCHRLDVFDPSSKSERKLLGQGYWRALSKIRHYKSFWKILEPHFQSISIYFNMFNLLSSLDEAASACLRLVHQSGHFTRCWCFHDLLQAQGLSRCDTRL